mmetsp:Transcript_2083/g.5602  ORF Transcript_2083/g.5602 Transcript_2083/m.5602 type:complete len:205 (-) Transcript_2083:757-1371(-)
MYARCWCFAPFVVSSISSFTRANALTICSDERADCILLALPFARCSSGGIDSYTRLAANSDSSVYSSRSRSLAIHTCRKLSAVAHSPLSSKEFARSAAFAQNASINLLGPEPITSAGSVRAALTNATLSALISGCSSANSSSSSEFLSTRISEALSSLLRFATVEAATAAAAARTCVRRYCCATLVARKLHTTSTASLLQLVLQ